MNPYENKFEKINKITEEIMINFNKKIRKEFRSNKFEFYRHCLREIMNIKKSGWNGGVFYSYSSTLYLNILYEEINEKNNKLPFKYQGEIYRVHCSMVTTEDIFDSEKEDIIKRHRYKEVSYIDKTVYSDNLCEFSKYNNFYDDSVWNHIFESEFIRLFIVDTKDKYGIDINKLIEFIKENYNIKCDYLDRFDKENGILFVLQEDYVKDIRTGKLKEIYKNKKLRNKVI